MARLEQQNQSVFKDWQSKVRDCLESAFWETLRMTEMINVVLPGLMNSLTSLKLLRVITNEIKII